MGKEVYGAGVRAVDVGKKDGDAGASHDRHTDRDTVRK
jgi:hypothetical protein